MIQAGQATGDSAEYEQIARALDQEGGAPLSVIADAVRHIMKRLGPPEDEQSLAKRAADFERERRV